jgi:hydrogenase/urease accessory protein HupE
MARLRLLETAMALLAIGLASSASAHPVPFTYLDVRIAGRSLELSLVAHVFDVGHDVGVDPPDQLLQDAVLRAKAPEFATLLNERLHVTVDGQSPTIGPWSDAEALTERQSIRLHARAELARGPGIVTVDAHLFPYDPVHQTFVNFYEADRVTAQAILDAAHTEFTYYSGTAGGTWAVTRTLLPRGIVHNLTGLDHLLFLGGLLVLASSRRQQLLIVGAFTAGQMVTLCLAILNLVTPPARLVDPAIALAIVYVGIDNLMVHDGRDVRVWMSLAFGAIHGFSIAPVLRSLGLAPAALVWSIVAVNVGTWMGQLAAALAIAAALSALRSRSDIFSRRLAVAGSWVLIAAGAFWFVRRVFFPGAMA